jgi:hypothetical protein
MENEPPTHNGEDAKSSRRGRLMGKLFGAKERKPTTEESSSNLNDFLHSGADTFQVSHAAPQPLPVLAKLDTTAATRYPQALAVGDQSQQSLSIRQPSRSPGRSPRRTKKGLVVRFVDTWPEIIGEGGDECEAPTVEIFKRRRARPPVTQPPQQRPPALPDKPSNSLSPPSGSSGGSFDPGPLKRTQTGFSSIVEPLEEDEQDEQKTVLPGRAASTRYLDTSRIKDENRRSFIEIHQAEMREAEGQAFAQAARSTSAGSQHNWEERRHSPSASAVHESPTSVNSNPRRSPEHQVRRAPLENSPSSVYSNSSSIHQQNLNSRQASINSHYLPSASTTRQASFNLHDVVSAAGDDAFNTFAVRVRHLFELFRLHAEASKPISASTTDELARAALWWFIKGRMALENAVRERPGSPQAQMQNEMDRQQAYTNLAKSYWLCQEAIPEVIDGKNLSLNPEVEDARVCAMNSLKKLTISMKRNGFLPPEEPFLPQTIDKSIWVEYPKLTQDVVALLTGEGSALMGSQRQAPRLDMVDSLPVGDTSEYFNFGRITVTVFFMEQDSNSEGLRFPCLMSMVRPQKQPNLVFVLASQNGDIQLRIQGNKNIGPTWEDVRWRNDLCAIDIKLPRGFMLAVRCIQQDYRMLWNMYDFGSKVQATLYPRKDEEVVFRSTLRAFQYFDSDPQSRTFPKESVAQCDLALFEKILKEGAAAGPRSYHRGFRVAVVTGPRTRTLSGVNHAYSPLQPVQFGFLRGENDDPALLLKFYNNRQKGSMVMSFNDEKERMRFHSLLIGTALHHDEKVYADVPLAGYTISRTLFDQEGISALSRLTWKATRVINDEHSSGGDTPHTVLSDKLRVVVDFKNGTVTDRINVAPGELKIRLEVNDAKALLILRSPQEDLTISVSEAQVSRELPKELGEALQTVQQSQTIRTLKFLNLKDLHDFQAAITGFTVVFDCLASTFAILRRRMVVPIHKKWEAGYTRIQVVQQEKVLQLLAFFPDFHHGQCMNFVLKGTDVFETFNRSGKAGLKMVDAKFPLPKMPDEGDPPTNEMGFVCLDLPEIPGEHDDISMTFELESGRCS